MCGIFGTSRTTETWKRMVPILADRMEMRGHDSWGVTDGDFIFKETGRITDRFQELDLEAPFYHTRAASCGAISDRNAHPFDFTGPDGTRIVGIHNGHISNWSDLKTEYKRDKLEVDSEHIFMHLAEKRDLGELSGWGAVVWQETLAGRTRRFASRFGSMDNLHIAKLLDGTDVFASTQSSIETAARFANVGIKHFYTIKENQLYEFGPEYLLDGGPLNWQKNVKRTETVWGHAMGSHTSGGYGRNFMSNICAAPGCTKSVTKDQLICKACLQEVMVNYGKSWAALAV